MRRVLPFLIFVSACAAASSPAWCAGFPRTVSDSRGVAVTFKTAPKRIVSLTPGTTEMLFALGAGNRVVGDTAWCDYPEAAKKIAKIGDLNPNYERIVAAHPDLVVVDDVAEKNAPARLQQLHIPFFVIHPTTYKSVEDTLLTLGRAIGQEKEAESVRSAMEKQRSEAATAVQSLPKKSPRVLIVVGTGPLWVASRNTFIGDVVRLAGGTVMGDPAGSYVTLTKEWIIGHPPDVILASPRDQAALKSDPVLSRIAAVRNGRMADTYGNALMRPGPRLGDGLVQVAEAMRKLLTR